MSVSSCAHQILARAVLSLQLTSEEEEAEMTEIFVHQAVFEGMSFAPIWSVTPATKATEK